MYEPSLLAVRIHEKRERVVQLVQGAAVGADEPEADPEAAEGKRRPVDVERDHGRPGAVRPADRRGLDGVLGHEQARRIAQLEVEPRRLDGRVRAQVDLQAKRLAGQELLPLTAARVEQAGADDLGFTAPPLAQAGASFDGVEIVGRRRR